PDPVPVVEERSRPGAKRHREGACPQGLLPRVLRAHLGQRGRPLRQGRIVHVDEPGTKLLECLRQSLPPMCGAPGPKSYRAAPTVVGFPATAPGSAKNS